MTAAELVARLDGVQGRGPRWRAICPAHESRHGTRSLSIFEADDRLLLRCFAGCDAGSIVSAIGMQLSDLFELRPDDPARRPGADTIKRPWRSADVIQALRGELLVGMVILLDVKAGKPIPDHDRIRAGEAVENISHLIDELTNAH